MWRTTILIPVRLRHRDYSSACATPSHGDYSARTEEAYVQWIKRFNYFSGRRHPADMGAEEVTAFLNHLARQREVAAATQNQALSALLFL